MIRGALSIASRRSGAGGCAGLLRSSCAARPISTTSLVPASVSTSFMEPDGLKARPNNCHGSLTKIVATIGPTSEQLPVLQQLVHAGMTVMRLNFSHATVEEVELRTSNLKACKVRYRFEMMKCWVN